MPDNEMPSENKMAACTLREVAKVYRDWHGPNSTIGARLEKRADELDPPAPPRTIEDKLMDAVSEYYDTVSPETTLMWSMLKKHGVLQ